MPLSREVGLSRSDIVLDGDPAPLPKRWRSPQFSAYICCGQMAGWNKMPLGREVGLSQSDIVLYGDQAPLRKRGRSPQFSAHVYCGLTGWMDQDATW